MKEWICNYCKQLNKAENTYCSWCGEEKSVFDLGEAWICSRCRTSNPGTVEVCEHCHKKKKVYSYKPYPGFYEYFNIAKILFLTFALIYVGVFVTTILPDEIRWDNNYTVKGYKTEHVYKICRDYEVETGSWRLPSDAKFLSSEKRVYSYNKDTNEPEYDTYFTYIETKSDFDYEHIIVLEDGLNETCSNPPEIEEPFRCYFKYEVYYIILDKGLNTMDTYKLEFIDPPEVGSKVKATISLNGDLKALEVIN